MILSQELLNAWSGLGHNCDFVRCPLPLRKNLKVRLFAKLGNPSFEAHLGCDKVSCGDQLICPRDT